MPITRCIPKQLTVRRLGPHAKAAKPASCPLEGGSSYGKGDILAALTDIDPDDPELIPLLAKSLDDPKNWRAIRILGERGPRAKQVLGKLETRLLNRPDKDEGWERACKRGSACDRGPYRPGSPSWPPSC